MLYAIDKGIFNDKAITYFLNSAHQKGRDKSNTFKKTFGLIPVDQLTNKLYDFLCNRLVDYENNLYQVEYKEYGVVCKYISAFIDSSNPKKILYMLHGWMSRYSILEDKDVELLTARHGAGFDLSGPVLDGWGRLTTLFVCESKNITQPQRDFVNSKNFKAIEQVKALEIHDQEQKGGWIIDTEEPLLANSDDWRKCLPAREDRKDYLFVDLPPTHYKYNSDYFPSSLFGKPTEVEAPVEKLPYGDYYGIFDS